MSTNNASLEALIREAHERSHVLFFGAFELIDEENLLALKAELSKEHDPAAPPCFMPDWLDENFVDDAELQAALAARVEKDVASGMSLSALEVEIREDVNMNLAEHLGEERETVFETSS